MKLKKMFNKFTKNKKREIEVVSVLLPMVIALFMAFNIFWVQLTPYVYGTLCLLLASIFSLVAFAYNNIDKQNKQLN